jgi:hypothetical protein
MKSGDRVKTNRRDATMLACIHRAGKLKPMTLGTVEAFSVGGDGGKRRKKSFDSWKISDF